MKAADLMTSEPACVTPDDSVQRAALLMAGKDCGAIPVVESLATGRVVGVITDVVNSPATNASGSLEDGAPALQSFPIDRDDPARPNADGRRPR